MVDVPLEFHVLQDGITIFIGGEFAGYIPVTAVPTGLRLLVAQGTVQIADVAVAPLEP